MYCMTYFNVIGKAGKKDLTGTIAVHGAKNAALKAIAASVLLRDQVRLTNLPHIEDVSRLLDLLESMGGMVSRKAHEATIDAHKLSTTEMTPEISKRIRASIVLAGPLLARYGKVSFPHPGGCVIGARPIDLFIDAFTRMGAQVKEGERSYEITTPNGGLRGAEIFFNKQTVTGTETVMMAAVLAKGTTVIKNAALEPEIVWLAGLLNNAGAKISGAGTTTITIKGVSKLAAGSRKWEVMPDRIEAGSFLILGALLGKKLTVADCEPAHLEALLALLEQAGAELTVEKKRITISAGKKPLRSVEVKTHEYPGFPTDLQAPMTVLLTQAEGESLVFETIFEGRLNYTESLNQMGANISMMDPHRVLVRGPKALRGRNLESPDLRAGLAFIIAGAVASGETHVHNVYNIDRGYESIEERLRAIGVDISRVE